MSNTKFIKREDPQAIEKLQEKLNACQSLQEKMKSVNAYYKIFDEKPDEKKRTTLKSRGFHWSPSENAWQRLLNGNAIYAAGRIEFLKPLNGSDPIRLQPKEKTEKETARDDR